MSGWNALLERKTQILTIFVLVKYREYHVIIVSIPKILCNIVWTQKKDIAEGWSWVRQELTHGIVRSASVLLNLGDSVTTDHISPAGSIPRFFLHTQCVSNFGLYVFYFDIFRNSPAARYLASRGLTPRCCFIKALVLPDVVWYLWVASVCMSRKFSTRDTFHGNLDGT